MPVLLRALGNGWSLEIVGRYPELPPYLPQSTSTTIDFRGPIEVETFDPKTGKYLRTKPQVSITPIFFESISYDVYFAHVEDASVTCTASLEKRYSHSNLDHYAINFGNTVGYVEFNIVSGSDSAVVRVEVFPRKIDYRTDYVELLNEVSGIFRNLAMTANAKTFNLAEPIFDHRPTLVEWFALLRQYFDEFFNVCKAITKHPHMALIKQESARDVDRLKHINEKRLNSTLLHVPSGNGYTLPTSGVTLPTRMHERRATNSFDTPENRYFKAVLQTTFQNIRQLLAARDIGDEDSSRESERQFFDSINPELKSMEKRLATLMRTPFLRSVSKATVIRPSSMVLRKHPLYSRFEKVAHLLNAGLSLADGPIRIGVKDTALLYEYWCFLKIVELLRRRFDLEEQSIMKINRFKMTVTLAKGKSSAMKFVHKSSGRPLYVVYNRLFNRLPTIAQKPDNVIQMATDDKMYVFDAKYRLQFDSDYIRNYGSPGPMTDDVNTMHRYRDAIALPHPLKPHEYKTGVVIGAAVLFPYHDEKLYAGHKFYNSLSVVEIGGLPFLPGTTQLMEAKIAEILSREFPEF